MGHTGSKVRRGGEQMDLALHVVATALIDAPGVNQANLDWISTTSPCVLIY